MSGGPSSSSGTGIGDTRSREARAAFAREVGRHVGQRNTFIHLYDGKGGSTPKRPTSAPPSQSSSQQSQESMTSCAAKSSSSGIDKMDHLLEPTNSGPRENDDDDLSEDSDEDGDGNADLNLVEGRRRRPCKGKRKRYQKMIEKIESCIRANPSAYDLDLIEKNLPPSIQQDERSKTKVRGHFDRVLRELRGEPQRVSTSASRPGVPPFVNAARGEQPLRPGPLSVGLQPGTASSSTAKPARQQVLMSL
eukprot:CAMPEP_0171180576 /NCGR_PEP_ID=MMETSP0790-20130122/13826_1 /TAXON_ID=2925 /ORGANISM="Alexandrium catenella, Strain OF101" /LENGTH=248 /DNA_ID=CAMNT_0011645509 /DNA_START=119 /DNA_END=865 /DNA_ORIENTATION=+